jgi:hypothetical protein
VKSSALPGLVGSGRSNIAETIFGVTPSHLGHGCDLFGKAVSIDSPTDGHPHGMAFPDRGPQGNRLSADPRHPGKHADRGAAGQICQERFRAGKRAFGRICEEMCRQAEGQDADLYERIRTCRAATSRRC